MKTGNGKKIKIASASLLSVLLCIWIAACKPIPRNTETGTDSSESFSKIYDKPNKSKYTALDIKQTEDGGYTILGKVEKNPYLLRINAHGEMMWDSDREDFRGNIDYVNPTPRLLIINKEYYLCAHKQVAPNLPIFVTALLKYSEKDKDQPVTEITFPLKTEQGILMAPLSAEVTSDGRVLILGVLFDVQKIENLNFISAKINPLTEMEDKTEVEKKFAVPLPCILNYPLYEEQSTVPYNFFGSGQKAGNNSIIFQTYLNCDDCTNTAGKCFSLITQDSMTGEFVKDIQMNEPLVAMEYYTEYSPGNISAARVDGDVMNFFVNVPIEEIGTKTGDPQYEINIWESVHIKTIDLDQRRVVFFAGSAKNNRIVLYTYDHSTGEYINKIYFGHTHVYQASGLIGTDDGGLAILGTTYMAGRLGRICLFKLSKSGLEDIVDPGQ